MIALALSVTLSERCYGSIFVLARFGRGLFIVLAFSVTLSERCYVLIFVLARFGRGAETLLRLGFFCDAF